MSILNEIIDRLQAAFPVNRIVALLLPFYSAAAGAIAAYASQKLPFLGNVVTQDEVAGIFVAVTAGAIAAGYKWLDGWQKYEVKDTADVPLSEPEDEGAV